MNKILDLIMKAPGICGVEQAGRWAEAGRLLYEHEIANPYSVFARQTGEDFITRCQVWDWRHLANDRNKADYIYWLLSQAGHYDTSIKYSEGIYSDVDQILLPSEAVALGWTPA